MMAAVVVAPVVALGATRACYKRYRFREAMRALGEWRGRTRQEIEAAIAAPRAAAQLGNGATVLEWVCEGYRVFAMFDERDRCLGITRSSLSLVSSARQRLRRAPQPTTGDDAEPVLQRTGTD